MAKLPAPYGMRLPFRKTDFLVAAVSALALCAPAEAKFYVFGDSLTDTGNIDKITFGAEPGGDYFSGRFSNGPVWSELMGYRLGKAPGLLYYDPVFTSRVDGFNFAHGGAAAVERAFLPDFLEAPGQASYYARQVRKGRMSGRSDDIAALWVGGNDYLLYDEGSAPTVVAGVMKSLTTLDATGVGRIVVMNLPYLGEIPGEIRGPDRAQLNIVSRQHNSYLNRAIAAYRPQARAQIVQVDIATMFTAVRRGAGGFTVTRPGQLGSRTGTCKGDGLLMAACPANYFFYDGVHPTASGHRFIAGVVRDRLAAPIAASARIALGQASTLTAMTTQLDQIKSRLAAAPDVSGPSGYTFSAGDAGSDRNWSQGHGADWRTGDFTFGVNILEADRAAELGETAAMAADAQTTGYAAYAAWRDDGLSAAVSIAALHSNQSYRRQTEIEALPLAWGSGAVTAASLQGAISKEFSSGAFSLRPEATLTWTTQSFSAFGETGTMGLSDNEYEALSIAGAIGEVSATLRYAEDDWGMSLRGYGVANLNGEASVWTAANAALIPTNALTPDDTGSRHGAGLWAELWLAESEGWSLTAGGGAFTDTLRTESAARVALRVEF